MSISVDVVKTLSSELVECLQTVQVNSEFQESSRRFQVIQEMTSYKRVEDSQLVQFSSGPFQDFPEDWFRSSFLQANFKSFQ